MAALGEDTTAKACGNAIASDAKLVHEVRRHPALYDPRKRGYKDCAEMDRSWLQISNALGIKRKSERR